MTVPLRALAALVSTSLLSASLVLAASPAPAAAPDAAVDGEMTASFVDLPTTVDWNWDGRVRARGTNNGELRDLELEVTRPGQPESVGTAMVEVSEEGAFSRRLDLGRYLFGGARNEVFELTLFWQRLTDDGLQRVVLAEADVLAVPPPPTLTARVRSEGRTNAAGWYRTPATVSYVCDGDVARGACPDPVTRSTTAPDFVLARSVTDRSGRTATARTPLQVDTTGPAVRTTLVGRAPYTSGTRPVRCTASDATSGVAGTCAVTYGAVVRRNGTARRSWSAAARDVAGNRTTRTGSFTVR